MCLLNGLREFAYLEHLVHLDLLSLMLCLCINLPSYILCFSTVPFTRDILGHFRSFHISWGSILLETHSPQSPFKIEVRRPRLSSSFWPRLAFWQACLHRLVICHPVAEALILLCLQYCFANSSGRTKHCFLTNESMGFFSDKWKISPIVCSAKSPVLLA